MLGFQYPFRKHQRKILARVDQTSQACKQRITAPPGAGKTIAGIELINQMGTSAIVFAPPPQPGPGRNKGDFLCNVGLARSQAAG